MTLFIGDVTLEILWSTFEIWPVTVAEAAAAEAEGVEEEEGQ